MNFQIKLIISCSAYWTWICDIENVARSCQWIGDSLNHSFDNPQFADLIPTSKLYNVKIRSYGAKRIPYEAIMLLVIDTTIAWRPSDGPSVRDPDFTSYIHALDILEQTRANSEWYDYRITIYQQTPI